MNSQNFYLVFSWTVRLNAPRNFEIHLNRRDPLAKSVIMTFESELVSYLPWTSLLWSRWACCSASFFTGSTYEVTWNIAFVNFFKHFANICEHCEHLVNIFVINGREQVVNVHNVQFVGNFLHNKNNAEHFAFSSTCFCL